MVGEGRAPGCGSTCSLREMAAYDNYFAGKLEDVALDEEKKMPG
jgi:hypothetical protein